MALKALDIYKLLPKTNCKKCGYPTCLAFAMKLAAGKADVESCPDMDEETKAILGGATRPPVRKVKIGVGERAFAVGEEFVLYRHEKTFCHQPGIMYAIDDTMDEKSIRHVAEEVRDMVLHRVGQDLTVSGLALRHRGGSPEEFGAMVKMAEECADLPEVVMAEDPAAQEAALVHCGHYRPLIHAATGENYKEMCRLATDYGCPMAVKAAGTDALAGLVKKCRKEGVEDLILDPAPESLRDFTSLSTRIRKDAVERTNQEIGYPLFLDAGRKDLTDAAMILGILRYASVIVCEPLSPAPMKAALTLRQNIYTDPQKPIQVTPGIYPINNPGTDAPVLLSVNFSLTFFTLQGYLDTTRVPCYMFVVDTEGMSVLTAVAGGKLTETLVNKSIKEFGLEDRVEHRKMIIPGYAAPLSGRIEDETGWKVLVGPRDAAEIGKYLEKECSA